MNAKKISTLLLCSAGIAMLAACSGKSLTRADAETKLDDMATAITNKSGYTAPTKVTVTGTAANYEYSNDDSFAHKKYVTDSKTTRAARSSLLPTPKLGLMSMARRATML
jgi:hypothetical protein